MPAIESLLRRWGFVKLRSFGLVLTPEGRIVSLRPTLLDDGSGGRVVGWKDNDLAAMELDGWDQPVRPMQVAPLPKKAPLKAPSKPVAAPKPAAVLPKPAVVVPPVVPAPVSLPKNLKMIGNGRSPSHALEPPPRKPRWLPRR
jgi:hypothetical protein